MCLMIGIMIGSLLGGPVGDKLGRKWGIVGPAAILGPLIVLFGLLPAAFEAYAAFTALKMICIAVIWVNCFPYVIELFGKEYRILFYVLMCLSHTLLSLYLPLLAYFSRGWRTLHVALGVTITVLTPALYFWLRESPRWLVVNGRFEEAEKMLTTASKLNGRDLDEDDRGHLKKTLRELSERAEDAKESKLHPLSLFAPKFLIRTLIVLSAFVSSTFAYYALALNVGSLNGNVFVNFAFSVLCDVPSLAYIYWFFNRVGRRSSIVAAQIVLFICCLGLAFTPKGRFALIMGFYLVGKAGANTTLLGIWFYSAELYPTNLRSQALGTCSLIARILALLAPFMTSLGELWAPAPMVSMGAPAIVSAALLLALPETKDMSLIETTNDNENRMIKGKGSGSLAIISEAVENATDEDKEAMLS